MKYMLMIYVNEAAMPKTGAGEANKVSPAYIAYTEAMRNAGILAGGERLQLSSLATTVRVADGKTNVLDGPYADTKEQLGGYYIIDVPDLDAALSWAARCPGAEHGAIEVRPFMPM